MLEGKKTCPICENIPDNIVSACRCGYDFQKNIIDAEELKRYMSKLKRDKNWVMEVTVKNNFTNFQIGKRGRASTSPEHPGWSFTKTAHFFNESKAILSTDIQLYEALLKNPDLKNCRNKTRAKSQINKEDTAFTNCFETESELQITIYKNWNRLLSEDWVLHQTHPFSFGKCKIGDVGEVDFLAKHRTEAKWLVIEIKKDKSSDAVVGQILRYMGWVKKEKANPSDIVEGMIITNDVDIRIMYALVLIPFLKLKTYKWNDGQLSIEDAPSIEYMDFSEKFNKMTKEEQEAFLKSLEQGAGCKPVTEV